MVKQQHSARQHRSTRYSIGPPDRSTRGSGRISYEKSQGHGTSSGRSETPDSVTRVLFQEGTTFHRVDPTKDSALYLGKSRRGRNLTALKSTGSLIEDDEA
eukprot:CAMPEP_0168800272 /NCGR_PEP_ID=MMETSP0725-20121227/18907_1 /TAXON_ID=265536 /ORGANISM="Amphiprora sp., Strain CCMP467" /LENGTH=100 /DNA_ID=CAMNT_0008851857 /DNA_START=317 /DNA_END=616 /DNA_ORIENTATION=+